MSAVPVLLADSSLTDVQSPGNRTFRNAGRTSTDRGGQQQRLPTLQAPHCGSEQDTENLRHTCNECEVSTPSAPRKMWSDKKCGCAWSSWMASSSGASAMCTKYRARRATVTAAYTATSGSRGGPHRALSAFGGGSDAYLRHWCCSLQRHYFI